MLRKIYKRMLNFIVLIKDLITFFLDEMNKRFIELNDKINEQNEYNEVLKDCAQLNCAECKFNEMCDFSNLKKERKINYDERRKRKKD